MNTITMAPASAPDFPLAHMNQEPIDDVIHANSVLAILCTVFDNAVLHGMDKDRASDVYSLLSDVIRDLAPIQKFLDNLDYPTLLSDYRSARRDVIVKGYPV